MKNIQIGDCRLSRSKKSVLVFIGQGQSSGFIKVHELLALIDGNLDQVPIKTHFVAADHR